MASLHPNRCRTLASSLPLYLVATNLRHPLLAPLDTTAAISALEVSDRGSRFIPAFATFLSAGSLVRPPRVFLARVPLISLCRGIGSDQPVLSRRREVPP
jgi:hypothetical protein